MLPRLTVEDDSSLSLLITMASSIYLYLSIYLFKHPSSIPSIYLPIHTYIYAYIYTYIHLCTIYLSLSICLFYPSIHLATIYIYFYHFKYMSYINMSTFIKLLNFVIWPYLYSQILHIEMFIYVHF